MTKKELKKYKEEIKQEQDEQGATLPLPSKKHKGLKIALSVILGIIILFTLGFCGLINWLTTDDTDSVNSDYRVEGNTMIDGDYEIEIKNYKVYAKNNPNNTDGNGKHPIIVFFYEVRNISDTETTIDASYEWLQVIVPIQDTREDIVYNLSEGDNDEYYSGDMSFEKNPEQKIKKGGNARGIGWYSLDNSTTPVELRHWLDENVKMTFEIKDEIK